MALFEGHFPYTNFHDLNLDWLLQKVQDHETRITSLEGRMDQAEQDIDALEERMQTAEDDIDALEGRMDTAEDDIDALEGRMDTAEDDIDALEGRMDTAEDDIDALEGRMDTAEDNIVTLNNFAALYEGASPVIRVVASTDRSCYDTINAAWIANKTVILLDTAHAAEYPAQGSNIDGTHRVYHFSRIYRDPYGNIRLYINDVSLDETGDVPVTKITSYDHVLFNT